MNVTSTVMSTVALAWEQLFKNKQKITRNYAKIEVHVISDLARFSHFSSALVNVTGQCDKKIQVEINRWQRSSRNISGWWSRKKIHLKKIWSRLNLKSLRFRAPMIFLYFPVCWARISGSVTENSRPRLPVVNKVVATFLGDDLEIYEL